LSGRFSDRQPETCQVQVDNVDSPIGRLATYASGCSLLPKYVHLTIEVEGMILVMSQLLYQLSEALVSGSAEHCIHCAHILWHFWTSKVNGCSVHIAERARSWASEIESLAYEARCQSIFAFITGKCEALITLQRTFVEACE
jgi:hypothetical protein